MRVYSVNKGENSVQKGTLMWIISICVAFVAAIVAGLSYAFVSRRVKEKLRKYENREEDEDGVVLLYPPIVAINERFKFETNYTLVAVILFFAWLVFLLDGPFNLFSLQSSEDFSVWSVIALLVVSLMVHVIICWVFTVSSFIVAVAKVLTLKEYYERRKARVFDRTSLVFIAQNQRERLNKWRRKMQWLIQNPRS